MKKVILKELTLTNFKGERSRTTQFQPSETTISGCNGIGKSRHFEAFLWLLFGKDSLDRKDYEIKTRIDGKELHKSECSVQGVLDVDNQTITLKRAFMEDWVKPRGKTEQVFKGNRTECWWNDAPVSVSEYSRRVHEIIDESIFKMITNPTFFAGMNWKLQREQLFKMAGTISDEEIAAGKPDFMALLDLISGKSLTDFKAERAAKKKRLKSELEEIQPRIDQTRRLMPEEEDYASIEETLMSIDKELKDIDSSLEDERKTYDKEDEERAKMREEANKKRSKIDEILFEERRKETLSVKEQNAERNSLITELSAKRNEEASRINNIALLRRRRETLKQRIEEDKKSQDLLRNEWRKENALEFNGDTICPHCGQPLPTEMLSKAENIFYETQDKKCKEITEQGQYLKKCIEQKELDVSNIDSLIDTENKNLSSLQEYISSLSKQIETLCEVRPKEIRLEDIPECVSLSQEVEVLLDKAKISTSISELTRHLTQRKKELLSQYSENATRLSKKALIERGEKEIEDLEIKGKTLAQQLADIEHEEFLLHEFSKARAEECEHRINSLFTIVSFQLYDETIDGNPIETCVPLINGVPYGSANTAGQLNAGLDIINALSRYYGIVAPVFLDRRESVNQIIATEAQIINLVVSSEMELKIY